MKLWLEFTWNSVKNKQTDYHIKDNHQALQMWEELRNNDNIWDWDKESNLWDKKKCYLMLILWNNTFPNNKINIDE